MDSIARQELQKKQAMEEHNMKKSSKAKSKRFRRTISSVYKPANVFFIAATASLLLINLSIAPGRAKIS